MSQINDAIVDVVGPQINDGLHDYFAGGIDPTDPDATLVYRFFENASLAPTKGPALTFTRALAATVKDNHGLLRTVPSNEPRFPGAEFVQNLTARSEPQSDVDTAPEAGVTYGPVANPLGAVNVVITSDNATESSYAYSWGGAPALVQGQTYLISAYVRMHDGTEPVIATTSGATGTFCFILGGVNVDAASRIVTPVGNGWYRCSATKTYDPTGSAGFIQYSGQKNFEGRSNVGIDITGLMIENISGTSRVAPSPYLKTDGAAAQTFLPPCQGLLIEESRQNIILQSEAFDQTPWLAASASVTVTPNATIAPDGTLTMDEIVEVDGISTPRISQSSTVTIGGTYAVSVYAKANTRSQIRIVLEGSGSLAAFFDLANGTVVGPGSGLLYTGIEALANGIYRCSVVYQATVESSSLYIATAENGATIPAGDSTKSVYLWGAQVEAGAFPTSYIRTVAAAQTRPADLCRTTDVSWYTPGIGSLYVEFNIPVYIDTLADWGCAVALYGDPNNYVRQVIRQQASRQGDPNFYLRSSAGQNIIDGLDNTFSPPSIVDAKWAVTWDKAGGNFAQFINGVANGPPSTPNAVNEVVTQLSVGENGQALQFINGIITGIAYANVRKSDEYLEAITA